MTPGIIIEREEINDLAGRCGNVPAIRYRAYIGFEGHTTYGYIAFEGRARMMGDLFAVEQTYDAQKSPKNDGNPDKRRFELVAIKKTRAEIDEELTVCTRIAVRMLRDTTGLQVRDLSGRLKKI